MKQPHHQRGREHDIYDRDDDEAATNGITTTGGDDGGTYDDSWHDGGALDAQRKEWTVEAAQWRGVRERVF